MSGRSRRRRSCPGGAVYPKRALVSTVIPPVVAACFCRPLAHLRLPPLADRPLGGPPGPRGGACGPRQVAVDGALGDAELAGRRAVPNLLEQVPHLRLRGLREAAGEVPRRRPGQASSISPTAYSPSSDGVAALDVAGRVEALLHQVDRPQHRLDALVLDQAGGEAEAEAAGLRLARPA